MRVHELRFGLGAGVGLPKEEADPPPSPLRYPPDNPHGHLGTRHFRLQFPQRQPVDRSDPKGPKNPAENLSFYANRLRTARFRWSEIAFTLDIPYPSDEQPLRVAKYSANPYKLDGEVARAFQLTPHRLVTSRVMTFTIPDGSEDISLLETLDGGTPAGEYPVVAGRISNDTRLHLYSQSRRPPHPGEAGHLAMLNSMLLLRKAGPGEQDMPFDLELNPRAHGDPLQPHREIDPDDFPLPSGLSFRDVLHLWEYEEFFKRPMHFADPAECGQGGGCFNHPPDCPDPGCEDPDCNCP